MFTCDLTVPKFHMIFWQIFVDYNHFTKLSLIYMQIARAWKKIFTEICYFKYKDHDWPLAVIVVMYSLSEVDISVVTPSDQCDNSVGRMVEVTVLCSC